VPSIVWALFFVSVAGLGAMPGVLALSMYSCGYLTKFYYDAFESARPRREEGPARTRRHQPAGLPPRDAAGVRADHRQPNDLRVSSTTCGAAAILGIVGAGGIGYYLNIYWDFFQYDKALACLILLLVVVLALDYLSSLVRRRLRE
jgi:phosphonate transport system permease protein